MPSGDEHVGAGGVAFALVLSTGRLLPDEVSAAQRGCRGYFRV